MGSNGAKHDILPNRATGAPVPKDDPYPVHIYALVRVAFDFLHGVKNAREVIISS